MKLAHVAEVLSWSFLCALALSVLIDSDALDLIALVLCVALLVVVALDFRGFRQELREKHREIRQQGEALRRARSER